MNHYVGVDLSEKLIIEAKSRFEESFMKARNVFKPLWIVNDAGDPNNLLDKVF